jgi:hypothetical protein
VLREESTSVRAAPPTASIVQALHRKQLAYRVQSAKPILEADAVAASQPAVPTIVLDRPYEAERSLTVNGQAIDPSSWTFDGTSLSWRAGSGAHRTSGAIQFDAGRLIGTGIMTTATGTLVVRLAVQPAAFHCLLSANAGAHATLGPTGGIVLNTAGVSWDTATWVDAGLTFTYRVVAGKGLGEPARIVPVFIDTATGRSWEPDDPIVAMDDTLALHIDTGGDPHDPDDRRGLPAAQSAFRSVYPTRMLAQFPPTLGSFIGGMIVDESVRPPLVYAIKATDVSIPTRARGTLVATHAAPSRPATTAPALDGNQLLYVSPFAATDTPKGPQYSDVVQREAVSDFYDLVKHNLADDLLPLAVPPDPATGKASRPILDEGVLKIAAMVPDRGGDPAAWYSSLGVAYLARVLVGTDDPFAKKLNGVRAEKWLTTATATTPIYNLQMPALYNRRFLAKFPILGDFQADQTANAATYAAQITADAAAWKQSVLAEISEAGAKPDAVKSFTDAVDEMVATATKGAYWAYWWFKHLTSGITLDRLHDLSMQPGANNTAFVREVQTGCAVLSALDPTGVFTRHYAEVVGLVQVGRTMPQYLDLGNHVAELHDIVPQFLADFALRFADSADAALREAAHEVQQAIDEQRIKDLLDAIVGLANSVNGSYEWRNIAELLPRINPARFNVTMSVVELVAAGCAVAGVAVFVMGAKAWQEMDPPERAALIAGGVSLFANIAMTVVKRAVAIVQIFRNEASTWGALKIILNPFNDSVTYAQKLVLSTSVRRILGGEESAQELIQRARFGQLLQPLLDVEADADAAKSMTKMERLCGRNLDEFAIRVGAIFAVVNLVLSAINLSEAADPLAVAQDSLFVASASIEVIAYAGGWILGAAGVEMIGALAVATIISACTFVAAALAVVGLIVTMVLMFEHHASPIEDFATNQARVAGFFMPFGAEIESFSAWAPADGPEQVAVTLNAAGASEVLTMRADGTVAYGPSDRTPLSSFILATDGTGQAQFVSQTGSAATPLVALAVGTDGRVHAAPYSSKPPAGTVQHWIVTLLAPPTLAPSSAGVVHATAGAVTLSPAGSPTQFLDLSGPSPRLSAVGTPLVLTVVPLAPQGLTMPAVALSTVDRDRQFLPRLAAAGSGPRTWTLKPAPPGFVTFDSGTGALTQQSGVAPPVMAPATYTLACTNGVGALSTLFSMAVTAPTGSA